MHILLITPFYLPDGGPSASMLGMLCEEFTKRGHKVTVISAVPHYPTGKVAKNFQHGLIQKDQLNEVQIFRVRVPSLSRKSLWKRMVQFLCFQIGASYIERRVNFDIALCTNPALESGIPFYVLRKILKKPVIFCIFDLYPDIGIKLGIFKHSLIISLVTKIEQFCLFNSNFIQVLSESFSSALIKQGISQEKISVIPVWVDTNIFKPLPRDNFFAKENGLTESFVVMYAGNMGLSQDFENIIRCSLIFVDEPDILFVIVGDGTMRPEVQERARKLNLKNLLFFPFQERNQLPEVLSTADIFIIPMRKNVSMDMLPSKSFTYMACGRPIIACVEKESDLAQLIIQSRSGVILPPEEPEILAKKISTFISNPTLCKEYGENGHSYVKANHSTQSAADEFEKLFNYILGADHHG